MPLNISHERDGVMISHTWNDSMLHSVIVVCKAEKPNEVNPNNGKEYENGLRELWSRGEHTIIKDCIVGDRAHLEYKTNDPDELGKVLKDPDVEFKKGDVIKAWRGGGY